MSLIVLKKNKPGSQKLPLIIVVSAKVAKRAVDRNLLKRRIREIMRPQMSKKKYDYTVITRPGATGLSFKELEEFLTLEIRN